ncbi:hypothetical protein OJF2_50230 [Aquisphaera giovannonii]|uniref:DUF434 domain-containing protein n=1 Tax=Aquisphaera giovannonii TaxID=406548 RepID=A0A5B9W8K0_9BACT|nr:DUF434 domain-containing protein [Aquisphaera giovannonii]QEH36459.1 hypothetical protein OJF2_50230 [Aquisphaera giovannonii]
MPDARTHRGPDPRDDEAFGPDAVAALRGAVEDLAWLLGRGYAVVSSLKLVGDRWRLTERQRMAVRRASCSDEARASRLARRLPAAALAGQELLIDGFNVLTTVEAALGGAVVLDCRDQTFRDVAGLHGSYRRVEETLPAARLLGERLRAIGVARPRWLFDRPVSNSGRIRAALLELAAEEGWAWSVELSDSPDRELRGAARAVATADAGILDRCGGWFNLARDAIEAGCPTARIVPLWA